MLLSERVKELRENAGLTQEELADRMGVQRNTVWRWENNRATMKADMLQHLAAVLNVDSEQLMMKSNNVDTPEKDKLSPTNLAYWGGVADNARKAVKSGQNLGLIYSLLSDAVSTVKAAMA